MPLVGTTFCDWVIMVVWSPDSKVWVFELIVMGGSSLTDSRSVSEASSSGYSDSSPTHWLCDPGTDLQQNEDNKVYFRDSSEDSIILWELNEIRHMKHWTFELSADNGEQDFSTWLTLRLTWFFIRRDFPMHCSMLRNVSSLFAPEGTLPTSHQKQAIPPKVAECLPGAEKICPWLRINKIVTLKWRAREYIQNQKHAHMSLLFDKGSLLFMRRGNGRSVARGSNYRVQFALGSYALLIGSLQWQGLEVEDPSELFLQLTSDQWTGPTPWSPALLRIPGRRLC